MDIQSSKIELVKLILSLETPEIIEETKSLLKTESKQKKIALTEYEKKEIELALVQLDKGERISFDNFLKKVS
ncbi:MAG: hypothetical protein GQ574_15310 [Crocinitomix sp.]|nr:hypothetical protein [Crocinitomix sp.]